MGKKISNSKFFKLSRKKKNLYFLVELHLMIKRNFFTKIYQNRKGSIPTIGRFNIRIPALWLSIKLGSKCFRSVLRAITNKAHKDTFHLPIFFLNLS